LIELFELSRRDEIRGTGCFADALNAANRLAFGDGPY
jgi:hypothetical protein